MGSGCESLREVGDTAHLFCQYVFSSSIWEFFCKNGREWILHSPSLNERLLSWGTSKFSRKGTILWNLLPHTICWALWEERDARVFDGIAFSVQKVLTNILQLFWTWSFSDGCLKYLKLYFQLG